MLESGPFDEVEYLRLAEEFPSAVHGLGTWQTTVITIKDSQGLARNYIFGYRKDGRWYVQKSILHNVLARADHM
ncbi:MAG TPA: hypothetical protein VJP02_15450 [Candidatus Sulfotelmatobacter sp.]|nr:hypothetical protein [Candidatus Sulfotelmatobacter sp.]